MMSYEKLDVYKIAMEFLALAIKIVSQLPSGHADLSDQLKRAAMSIPQNIGEGAGKRTPADCRKYFDTARGSAMERQGQGTGRSLCYSQKTRQEPMLLVNDEAKGEVGAYATRRRQSL